MKTIRYAFLLGIVAVPFAAHAVTFYFSVVQTGHDPDGPAPWATLDIVDNGANTVDFTLTNNAPANSAQFITELDLNMTPYPANPAFSVLSDPTGVIDGHSFSQNGVNGINGNKFDMAVDFSSDPPRFTTGKVVSWRVTGDGLTASAFDNNSEGGTGAMTAMLHIQGFADGSSGKLSPGAVPEPTTLGLLGLGLVGFLRRRKA